MWQIFVGSLILSLIHASIPNHWIPLIAISKTEKWTSREALFATFVTGFFHTASTILIGVIVGFVGIKLSETYEIITSTAAPAILCLVGLVYLFMDVRANYNHRHHHHHHFHVDDSAVKKQKSKVAILITLGVAMFLSPCLEIEAYYFQAANLGWKGILIVSLIYLLITILLMMTLVYFGLHGIKRINSHFLEHHEKLLTGVVLILLGLSAFFIQL